MAGVNGHSTNGVRRLPAAPNSSNNDISTNHDVTSMAELLERIRRLELQNTTLRDQLHEFLGSDDEEDDDLLPVIQTQDENDLQNPVITIHRVTCVSASFKLPSLDIIKQTLTQLMGAENLEDLEEIVEMNVDMDSRIQDDHGSHPQVSYFLDKPHLYAGDTHCSALRGERQIRNIHRYLENRESDTVFVVYKDYSCMTYSHMIKRMQKKNKDRHNYGFGLLHDTEPLPPGNEYLEILSKSVKKELEGLVSSNLETFYNWHIPEQLVAPYLHLYHFGDKIKESAQGSDSTFLKNIELVLDHVKKSYGSEYHDAETLFKSGKVSREHLSKLFAPGEVVVTFENDHPKAYKCEEWPTIDPDGTVSFSSFCWTFDGAFKRETSSRVIYWPKLDATEVSLTDLSAYPLKYAEPELRKRLEGRGNIWWSCRKAKYVSYEPPTSQTKYAAATPRFMIDYETYRRLHEESEAYDQDFKGDLDDEVMDQEQPPGDDFVLLLPPEMSGFAMHEKKWRTIIVEYIKDIQWNKTAFDNLVLHPKAKELIEALVKVHVTSASDITPDIVEGKGNGLIMLFHGPPGTGKTLTAEGVAEIAKRPLYRVTCGDVGTEPEAVEQYLESVLHIGRIWGCVVLLDEADVFLEERSLADLSRNALVSVFLRVLEYYEGILILTTNRVGSFDEAFKSRIHLAVHYPALEQKDRKKIWRTSIINLFRESERNDPRIRSTIEDLCDNVDQLSRHELNGRQIRNTVRTAKQLAIHREKPLSYSHFEDVIEVTASFEEYLLKTRGHTDEEYARESGTRY